MRTILEIVEGPLAGRRIEVPPGQAVSVGRTAKAEFAVQGDGYLSGRHFAVENTGRNSLLRDLGSSNGTFLNGARISEAQLNPFDLIAAGSSKFRVHIEAESAADASRTSTFTHEALFQAGLDRTEPGGYAPPMTTTTELPVATPWGGFTDGQTRILNALFAPGDPVFAILDAGRDPLVRAFVEACGEHYVSLNDTLVQSRAAAGSYLVSLPPTSTKMLDVLLKDGWGKQWGVYCTAPATLDQVAAHLKMFINVYSGNGMPFSLRLYDPNLLHWFLLGLMPHEQKLVFGPLRYYFLEADGGASLIRVGQGQFGLSVETTPVRS